MASKSRTTETGLEIVGLRELLKALNKIDKDLQNNVRDASQQIAYDLVSGAQRAASGVGKQAAMVSAGLKVKRDRVPTVRMPSTGMGGRGSKTKWTDVFYGAEFGGGGRPTTMQFPIHRGQRGYWLYPTARANSQKNFKEWWQAIDKAMKTWDYRPPS